MFAEGQHSFTPLKFEAYICLGFTDYDSDYTQFNVTCKTKLAPLIGVGVYNSFSNITINLSEIETNYFYLFIEYALPPSNTYKLNSEQYIFWSKLLYDDNLSEINRYIKLPSNRIIIDGKVNAEFEWISDGRIVLGTHNKEEAIVWYRDTGEELKDWYWGIGLGIFFSFVASLICLFLSNISIIKNIPVILNRAIVIVLTAMLAIFLYVFFDATFKKVDVLAKGVYLLLIGWGLFSIIYLPIVYHKAKKPQNSFSNYTSKGKFGKNETKSAINWRFLHQYSKNQTISFLVMLMLVCIAAILIYFFPAQTLSIIIGFATIIFAVFVWLLSSLQQEESNRNQIKRELLIKKVDIYTPLLDEVYQLIKQIDNGKETISFSEMEKIYGKSSWHRLDEHILGLLNQIDLLIRDYNLQTKKCRDVFMAIIENDLSAFLDIGSNPNPPRRHYIYLDNFFHYVLIANYLKLEENFLLNINEEGLGRHCIELNGKAYFITRQLLIQQLELAYEQFNQNIKKKEWDKTTGELKEKLFQLQTELIDAIKKPWDLPN